MPNRRTIVIVIHAMQVKLIQSFRNAQSYWVSIQVHDLIVHLGRCRRLFSSEAQPSGHRSPTEQQKGSPKSTTSAQPPTSMGTGNTYLGASKADCTPATHDLRRDEHEQHHDQGEEDADRGVSDSAPGGRALRKPEHLARSVDGGHGASLRPLAIAVDDRVLKTVDKLG